MSSQVIRKLLKAGEALTISGLGVEHGDPKPSLGLLAQGQPS